MADQQAPRHPRVRAAACCALAAGGLYVLPISSATASPITDIPVATTTDSGTPTSPGHSVGHSNSGSVLSGHTSQGKSGSSTAASRQNVSSDGSGSAGSGDSSGGSTSGGSDPSGSRIVSAPDSTSTTAIASTGGQGKGSESGAKHGKPTSGTTAISHKSTSQGKAKGKPIGHGSAKRPATVHKKPAAARTHSPQGGHAAAINLVSGQSVNLNLNPAAPTPTVAPAVTVVRATAHHEHVAAKNGSSDGSIVSQALRKVRILTAGGFEAPDLSTVLVSLMIGVAGIGVALGATRRRAEV